MTEDGIGRQVIDAAVKIHAVVFASSRSVLPSLALDPVQSLYGVTFDN